MGSVSDGVKVVLLVDSSKLVVAGTNCRVALAAESAVPLSWKVPEGEGLGCIAFSAVRFMGFETVK